MNLQHDPRRIEAETISIIIDYIDITGDLIAGMLLSFIDNIFTTRAGAVEIENFVTTHYNDSFLVWLVKKRNEWYKDLRITPTQYDRAIKILETKGIVVKKIMKYNGSPTEHISYNYSVVNKLLCEKDEDGKNG